MMASSAITCARTREQELAFARIARERGSAFELTACLVMAFELPE